MDGFNEQLKKIVGISNSIRFKLSFLCTPANLRLMNRHAQSSIHALETFIRNDAMLIAGTVEHSNDDHLYFGCNPDGLCSLRAARIATLNFFHRNEQSARDVDIKNVAEHETFPAMKFVTVLQLKIVNLWSKLFRDCRQELLIQWWMGRVMFDGQMKTYCVSGLSRMCHGATYLNRNCLGKDGIRGTSFKASQG